MLCKKCQEEEGDFNGICYDCLSEGTRKKVDQEMDNMIGYALIVGYAIIHAVAKSKTSTNAS